MTLCIKRLSFWLLFSWLSVGTLLTILSFLHWLYFPFLLLLAWPLLTLAWLLSKIMRRFFTLLRPEKWLMVAIIGLWLIHATGLLVPETGFDAVWYHLPVAELMIAHHGLVNDQHFYQTLNPLFSDLLYVAGFGLGREFGAKVVAFGVALTLMIVSYQVARVKLSRYWSLWVVLCISSFQVVAWQSTSFYVDLAKALWEIGALWVLVDDGLISRSRRWALTGWLFGAALATKAFTWVLLPMMTLIIFLMTKYTKKIAVFLLASLLLGCLFYIRVWLITGNPALSIALHVDKLDEIGGHRSPIAYLINRLVTLPLSPLWLTLLIRDYVSIVLLVFFPLLIWQGKALWRDAVYRGLLLFGLAQYLVWWSVPPLSTRYAVSGFMALMIVTLGAVARINHQKKSYVKPVLLVLALSVVINLAPRLLVAKRNLSYVLNHQSLETYISQFYDGNIDQHLQRWYRLSP